MANFDRHQNFDYCRRFRVEEVRCAISRMSRGRVTGLYAVLVEVWKSTIKDGMGWLTKFNAILKTAKMPYEWRSTMVPLYKNRDDIRNYNKYKDIKLLSYL